MYCTYLGQLSRQMMNFETTQPCEEDALHLLLQTSLTLAPFISLSFKVTGSKPEYKVDFVPFLIPSLKNSDSS